MVINPINIAIKKAFITDLRISLNVDDQERKPSFTISGKYLTAQNRAVSDFYFSSSAWNDETKIEVPQPVKDLAKEIFDLLTPILYDKVNNTFKELPVVASTVEPEKENPDDIPF